MFLRTMDFALAAWLAWLLQSCPVNGDVTFCNVAHVRSAGISSPELLWKPSTLVIPTEQPLLFN